MRLYQDDVVEIKNRYKNDPQKAQVEIMSFYGKKGINPLGGCLPMLPQFPFFIALFFALRESVELRHAPLGLWLQDLSAPDPLFILPFLMAFIMFMTQKLAPPMPGSDPNSSPGNEVYATYDCWYFCDHAFWFGFIFCCE